MTAGRPILGGIDWADVVPPVRAAAAVTHVFRIRILLVATLSIAILAAGDHLLCSLHDAAAVAEIGAVAATSDWIGVTAALHTRVTTATQMLVAPFIDLSSQTGTAWWVALLRSAWRLLWLPMAVAWLARMSVLAIARGEGPAPISAARFMLSRCGGVVSGVSLLVGGCVMLGLPLLAARGAMQVAWLAWPLAVVWPLVLLAAAVWTIYSFAAAVGWPLVSVTLATESTDAFDAVSRTFSYLFQRPWRLAACVGCGAIATALGAVVVEFALAQTLAVSATLGSSLRSPASVVAFWQSAATLVGTGYLLAASTAATCGTYLVLRRAIDGVEPMDVWVESAEYGLPPITEHAATRVAESEPFAKAG
jgi:hypothetical protein